MGLKLTARPKIPENCIGTPMTLRRVTSLVKDEKDDFVIDSHAILARWRKHFSQLLNVHEVNDVRQPEIPKQNH
jgi:hypothetical protein